MAKKNVSHEEIPSGRSVITEILDSAKPRPTIDDSQSAKNKYAVRFADRAALIFARDLHSRLPNIQASAKRDAGSTGRTAQLDVNFSTPQYGLVVGISLKSVHLRDKGSANRYTHNVKRNNEELRIEASGYHKRQPYAVMVGVLFLPFDSCDDAKAGASSFGSWVRGLRPYCGRTDPRDDLDRFEKLYVALYEPDGTDLRFFDVESAPPKSGRPSAEGPLAGPTGVPRRSLSYGELLDAIVHTYLHRNSAEFTWADGEESPITAEDGDDEQSVSE